MRVKSNRRSFLNDFLCIGFLPFLNFKKNFIFLNDLQVKVRATVSNENLEKIETFSFSDYLDADNILFLKKKLGAKKSVSSIYRNEMNYSSVFPSLLNKDIYGYLFLKNNLNKIIIARVSNRFWIDPKYRLKGLSLTGKGGRNLRLGSNWGVTIAYDFQINCCKNNNIDIAVITRENIRGPQGGNDLPFLYKKLKIIRPEWKLADKYYLTCSNDKDYRCSQRLIYRELTRLSANFLEKIPSIGQEEYYKRFCRRN